MRQNINLMHEAYLDLAKNIPFQYIDNTIDDTPIKCHITAVHLFGKAFK
jgi:hypothetical protein